MSEHTPLAEADREPESLRLFREAHEAAVAQGYTEGDVNHYVQPIVGMLRLAAHQGESIPPDQAEGFAGALMKGCNAETALLAYLKRRNDTYGLVHRDLYRYYTEDNTDMARLRRALDAIAAPTTDTGARVPGPWQGTGVE